MGCAHTVGSISIYIFWSWGGVWWHGTQNKFLISCSNRFHFVWFKYVTLSILCCWSYSNAFPVCGNGGALNVVVVGSEKLGFTAVFIAPKSGEEDWIRGGELALLVRSDRYLDWLGAHNAREGVGWLVVLFFIRAELFHFGVCSFPCWTRGGGGRRGGCRFINDRFALLGQSADMLNWMNQTFFHRRRLEEDLPFIAGPEG